MNIFPKRFSIRTNH